MSGARALLALLGLALALRLGAALAWAPPLEADAADYHRLAVGLVEGRGYVDPRGRPTSWRPPLYPGFVAAVYGVAGPSPGAVRAVQALVGTGTVACVYGLGTLLGGPPVGAVAALLVALDPAQVFATSHLLSEGLFTLLFVGALLAAALATRGWARGRRALLPAAAAGALLALATLTRPVALLLPPVLVAAAAVLGSPAGLGARTAASPGPGRRGAPARGLAAAAVAAVVFVGVLAPWSLRNQRVHGEMVPVATQGGATFYSGQNPVDGWIFGLLPSDSVTARAAELPEPEASEALFQAGLRSLAADPLRALRLVALKAVYFWAPVDWEVMPWYGALNPVYLLAVLWAAGLLVLARARPGPERLRLAWPAWLPVLYMFAMGLAFYGSPRFRLPVDPLLAILAAAAMVGLARRRGRRAAVRVVAATAAVAAALVPLGPLLRGLVRRIVS